MKTIEITMVAASRVGKTSLLAAMQKHLKVILDKTDCYIEAIDNTINELQERETELHQMFETSHPMEFTGGGIYPTVDQRTYHFRIGRKGKPADLEIVFVDIPGGKYTAKDEQIRAEVDEQIRRSIATFIPIDVAALFEGNGFFHQKVNQPVFIQSLYERAFNSISPEEQRLIILTPVKCEKYLQQPNGIQQVVDKILEQHDYRALLSFVKSKRLEKQIKVAICPVQTVGGIHVVNTQLDSYGNAEHLLRRVGSYQAQSCHLPLLYLFFSILQMTRDDRASTPIIGWFRRWFQTDKYLTRAIEQMLSDLRSARQKKEIIILQQPLQNANFIL